MAYLLLIAICTFFLMVDQWNLGPALVWLSNLPSYYWSGIILCLTLYKIVMFLQTPYYTLKKMLRRLRKWIDEEDQTGPPPPSAGPGANNPGNQRRSYSTSASQRPNRKIKGFHRLKSFKDKAQAVLIRTRVSSSVVITTQKINDTFRVKAKGLLGKAFGRIAVTSGLRVSSHIWRVIYRFILDCKRYHKNCGMEGLVLVLKSAHVLTSQALGGFRLHDCSELKFRISRNGQGLPRHWINSIDRAKIRKGDTAIMRFYLSLFSLYRVLEFPGTLKLSTITSPQVKNSATAEIYSGLQRAIPLFVKLLSKYEVKPLHERVIKPTPILRSAPGAALGYVSTDPITMVRQIALLRFEGILSDLVYFVSYFSPVSKKPVGMVFGTEEHTLDSMSMFHQCLMYLNTLPDTPALLTQMPFAGKLGIKHEPAGKERVFAMVDSWTQWTLTPFHDYLFDILKHLPMDGTFDQLAPIYRMQKVGFKCAYSLDLSAATDRIPIDIQKALVAAMVNPIFADHWAKLLVARSYYLPAVDKAIKYEVGQPMGAKSSWPMLAIIHHCIIQFAAWSSGVTPWGVLFTDYAVLGDDVVIFDQKVKERYVIIMTALGVEMGLSKSLLSADGSALEFAKRIFYKNTDVSPIPLIEFISSNLALSEAIAFARKYGLSFHDLLLVLGYGKRVRGSLNKSFSKLNSRIKCLMFAFYLPQNESEFLGFLSIGNPLVSKAKDMEILLREFCKNLLATFLPTAIAPIIMISQKLIPHVGENWFTDFVEKPVPQAMTAYEMKVKGMIDRLEYWLKCVFVIPILQQNSVPVVGEGPLWFGTSTESAWTDHKRIKPMIPGSLTPRGSFIYTDGVIYVDSMIYQDVMKVLTTLEYIARIVVHNLSDPLLVKTRDELKRFMYKVHQLLGFDWSVPSNINKLNTLAYDVFDEKTEPEKSAGGGFFFMEDLGLNPLKGKSVWDIYQMASLLAAEYAAIAEGIRFEKFDPPLPYRSDPKLQKMWKIFTAAILNVVRTGQVTTVSANFAKRLRSQAKLHPTIVPMVVTGMTPVGPTFVKGVASSSRVDRV